MGETSDAEATQSEVAAALAEMSRVLSDLGAAIPREAEGLTEEIWLEALAALGRSKRDLHPPLTAVSSSFGLGSAKARIRAFLLSHVGQVVTKDELSGLAGASEWARRLRELSVEEGFEITRGPEGGLRPGEYRLDNVEANTERAARWRAVRQIRRRAGSGSARCLELLQLVYPAPASASDLMYVARINSFPRRIRELDEAGWLISSNLDDPSLPPGSYRLESLEKGPARSREAIKHRRAILERDGWRCQECGASPTTSPGTRLQVHHRVPVSQGGSNEDTNLVTLCVPCHAGAHAASTEQVADELLEPAKELQVPT